MFTMRSNPAHSTRIGATDDHSLGIRLHSYYVNQQEEHGANQKGCHHTAVLRSRVKPSSDKKPET